MSIERTLSVPADVLKELQSQGLEDLPSDNMYYTERYRYKNYIITNAPIAGEYIVWGTSKDSGSTPIKIDMPSILDAMCWIDTREESLSDCKYAPKQPKVDLTIADAIKASIEETTAFLDSNKKPWPTHQEAVNSSVKQFFRSAYININEAKVLGLSNEEIETLIDFLLYRKKDVISALGIYEEAEHEDRI